MKRCLHILLSGLIFGGILLASSCKPKKTALTGLPVQRSEISFDDYFIDATTHFNNNNYEMALKLYNKCVDINPTEASTYYQISRIYNSYNANEKALQYALKANQINASNAYYAIWYARLLRNINNLNSAESVLENCRKANPKDDYVVKELDALYALQSATDKRITIWKDLVDAKGFKLNYGLKLIELYRQKKDYAAAHQIYDNIKKAAPGKYQYWIDDGNLYLESGDKVNAFLNFEKALSINPNNWQLNQTLYKHYQSESNNAQAGKYLELGLKDPYTTFDTKAVLVAEIFSINKKDPKYATFALLCADVLADQYKQNANALNTAATIYEFHQQTSKADLCYTKCIDLQPNTFDAWLGAIRCHKTLYGPAKTLNLIDSALEYFPNTAALYVSAASNGASMKNWNKVAEYASNGLSFALITEDIKNLNYYKALAEFHKNDFNAALKTLNTLTLDETIDGKYFELLGDINYKLNKTDQALTLWKKAQSAGANNTMLTKKITDGKYHE